VPFRVSREGRKDDGKCLIKSFYKRFYLFGDYGMKTHG